MIYFIQTADNQFIKIGKADNPAKRLIELQTAVPHALKLLATIPGGHEQERAIHRKFRADQVRGEWYRATNRIVGFAVAAQAAQIEPTSPFFRLAILETRLIDLYVEAAAVIDDGSKSYFCANSVWYGYYEWRGIKPRLERLVGWDAEQWHIPELKTMTAYDTAYETIYEALPGCRDCSCA